MKTAEQALEALKEARRAHRTCVTMTLLPEEKDKLLEALRRSQKNQVHFWTGEVDIPSSTGAVTIYFTWFDLDYDDHSDEYGNDD